MQATYSLPEFPDNIDWLYYLKYLIPIAFFLSLITWSSGVFTKSDLDKRQEKLMLTCHQLAKSHYSESTQKWIYKCLDGTPEGLKRLEPGYRPPNPNN